MWHSRGTAACILRREPAAKTAAASRPTNKVGRKEFHTSHPLAPIWCGPELTSHLVLLQGKCCVTSWADLWRVTKGRTDPGAACQLFSEKEEGHWAILQEDIYLTQRFRHFQSHRAKWMTWEKQEKLMTEETQGLNGKSILRMYDVLKSLTILNPNERFFYRPIKMVHFQHTYQHFGANEPDSGDLDRCTNANIRIAYGLFYSIVMKKVSRCHCGHDSFKRLVFWGKKCWVFFPAAQK